MARLVGEQCQIFPILCTSVLGGCVAVLLAHNMPECIPVRRGDALKGVVKREPHSRKPGCYILDDKYREYIILAQKLPTIVRYLNSTPTVVADATVRVSVMSLYQIQNSAGGGADQIQGRT